MLPSENTEQALDMRWLLTAALACAAAPVAAQDGETGDATLRNGMFARVLPMTDGITVEKDGEVARAGYFRIRIQPVGLSNIRCPKVAFRAKAAQQKWEQTDQAIYNLIFKANIVWSINARIAISGAGGAQAVQEIPLILIKQPNEKDCTVSPLTDTQGNAVDLSNISFLVPVVSANPVYGNAIQVVLRHAYTSEPNKQRIEDAWKGLQAGATVIAAPLGAVIGALTSEGTSTLEQKLSKRGGATAQLLFEATPAGAKADAYFVYLGFEPDQPNAASLTGGARIAADYQATMFRAGRFFDGANPLTADEILGAKPIRSAKGDAIVDESIRDRLSKEAWDGLAVAADLSAFNASCGFAQAPLRAIGLSDVDKDAFIWAVATKNAAVAASLSKITCLNTSVAKANLGKVGIVIADPPPSVPAGERASRKDMIAAMENLVSMIRLGAVNEDLSGRMAERINLVIIGDDLEAAAPADLAGLGRPGDAVLAFLVSNLKRGGCYIPRDEAKELPLRPAAPLPDKGRAGAMMVESKAGQNYVMSLGFDPVPAGQKAKVSTISLQRPGATADAVVRELAAGDSDICPRLPATP